ncbi:hypothetical protein H2202_005375 [Exophiala xenobiotica]|nr:hypothetical protein H2202_005375 [Exophiala xenobiotica]KAK5415597.1 hypothetical protein LTR06_003647 [Exophiala xenobiotica]
MAPKRTRHDRPAPVQVPGTAGRRHDSSSTSGYDSDPPSLPDPSSDNTSTSIARSSGEKLDWENVPEEPIVPSPSTVWGREHEIGTKRIRTDSENDSTTDTTPSYMRTPLSDLYSPPFYWNLPKSELQLTFGVELEHMFAYSRRPRKGYEFMFDQSQDGLELLSSYDPETHNGKWADVYPTYTEQSSPRRVETDSLNVHERILKHKGLQCRQQIHDTTCLDWTLCNDGSVCHPSDGPALPTLLPGKIKENEELDWTLGNHELVSRVLHVPLICSPFSGFKLGASLQEIEKYLTATVGQPSDPWGAFTNPTCGLHVHVACKPEEGIDVALPLPILQHLCYIIVQFEGIISSLHPVGRRSGKSNRGSTGEYIRSNLEGLHKSPHICKRRTNTESAEKKIFAKDMTEVRLAELMSVSYRFWPTQSHQSDRWKFVNFQRFVSTDVKLPHTVEFRQHAGTLDFDTIAHWVHFIASLVRAAERQARRSQPATPGTPKTPNSLARQLEINLKLPFPRMQGKKYKIRCAKLADEFDRLFDLLDFEREVRKYWHNRFVEFNPGEVVSLDPTDYGVTKDSMYKPEECLACQDETRDAE